MTKKTQSPSRALRAEKAAGKAAVLGAMSLLSASMGLLLNDEAKADSTLVMAKAKTADKAFNAMDGYVRGRQIKQPSKSGVNAAPKSSGGAKRK